MNIEKNKKKLNLENREELKTQKKIIANDKEITGQTYILQCLTEFYENLKSAKKKNCGRNQMFLRNLNIPKTP